MNSIIMNGVKSNTIKGLLIQSLPPISKPLIRTEVEEIDGRDGDIITNLGYAAYDKEISIGLHGNFDIDEVISYFNSEGTIIFSNEPDKYYNYTIIQQIDFERLIRFKTAKIVLHVQPFKYSAVERELIVDTENNTSNEIIIRNNGNTVSKPIMTIYGSGTINLSLNGNQVFVINLGEEEYITIDVAAMDASKDGILKNRLVTGDFDNFILPIGLNAVSWSGDVDSITFQQYSRWI